jgi:flagellar motor switch protein FliN
VSYFECWKDVATALFAQALAGEPTLTEIAAGSAEGAAEQPNGEAFGFVARVGGAVDGEFAVWLENGATEASLMGEGADQKAGWLELLREVAEAAAGDLLARTGAKVQVENFTESSTKDLPEAGAAREFRLEAGERSWRLWVFDRTEARDAAKNDEAAAAAKTVKAESKSSTQANAAARESVPLNTGAANPDRLNPGTLNPGVELLLDVELEAALRFGCRELPLGEILDLGPGDVVELDRHIADPVDLIVGDKIVARGEVVLVNGNFGLRVTEVAEPRRRLESIRCLF